MKEEIEISDLRKIIRELMMFIAVDGKQFVEKDKMEAYVMKYLQCFVKVMNDKGEGQEISTLDLVQAVKKSINK